MTREVVGATLLTPPAASNHSSGARMALRKTPPATPPHTAVWRSGTSLPRSATSACRALDRTRPCSCRPSAAPRPTSLLSWSARSRTPSVQTSGPWGSSCTSSRLCGSLFMAGICARYPSSLPGASSRRSPQVIQARSRRSSRPCCSWTWRRGRQQRRCCGLRAISLTIARQSRRCKRRQGNLQGKRRMTGAACAITVVPREMSAGRSCRRLESRSVSSRLALTAPEVGQGRAWSRRFPAQRRLQHGNRLHSKQGLEGETAGEHEAGLQRPWLWRFGPTTLRMRHLPRPHRMPARPLGTVQRPTSSATRWRPWRW
mmetsp:Transcript_29559/g.95433  ORF Transcript_29559/g.95433 Transcript_29559/m.95433 type:complete len:315 (-) Transcript_29559:1548-2492(-)